MQSDSEEKLNRVEELKTKLFSKNFQMKIEHRDNFTHLEKKDVPDSWNDESQSHPFGGKFFTQTSVFKRFFIFSISFFLLAVAYASYTFFIGGNTVSNDNIEISVLGNAFTAGGEDLPLTIGIINKNSLPLDLVDLVIEYPKSSSLDLSQETERLRESLGTIPAGGFRNENVKIVLFGEQGSIRPIKISLEYRVEGSNAIFVKEKTHQVSINSTPIDLSFDAPTTMSPNQDITLNVKATLNSTKTANNILVKVDYPVGFQFNSSNPKPSLGNNIWNLGDLASGAERNITIQGRMVDVFDGEEKTFRVWSGLQSETDKSAIQVVFNSLGHTVLINKPFIEAKLYVNGDYQREYSVDSKGKMTGEIRWANNLDTKINDLEIRAHITGNALNKSSILPQLGFYNSLTDEIVWDKNSRDVFAEVNPGDSGVVTFSLSPASLFSGSSGMLIDPSINIEVSISGKQELSGYSTKDLENSESKLIRIISDVGLVTKVLYYSGGFTNTGPIPPKVGQETTYTVVWSVSNTSNNVSKGVVSATLPSWVLFLGNAKPSTEDVTYNSFTREITWDIGSISKGTGITGGTKEVSFQIGLSPSLSQVGTAPVLINEAVLTGQDDFAKVNVRVSKPALSTSLNNDPGFPNFGERVVE
ncbi:DUF11 domain-containing protein [Candidatus Nomurabacteria bacterium]|nr:DUF11 domain-containing protein [Candidatus Nomurabacteria bacterium]